MKKACKVFLIIGIVLYSLFAVSTIIVGVKEYPQYIAGVIVYAICQIALAVTLNALTLSFLAKNKKSVVLGVFTLIFASLIGGILYLCWKPEGEDEIASIVGGSKGESEVTPVEETKEDNKEENK